MNLKRLSSLIVKERKQMLRDASNLAIGVVLPVVLLLIFGFGMSMDVRNIKLAIVSPERSEFADDLAARFVNSEYFDVQLFSGTDEGTAAVAEHRADACLFLPAGLERSADLGGVELFLAVNAANAPIARTYENCVRQVLDEALTDELPSPGVKLRSRMWYNSANDSRCFMIPGVIVIIMSLIGCMLTSLQMAREYEQGNMESVFATPVTGGEILLAKMVNNYVLGMVGLAISLLFARFLFQVPVRGSVAVLLLGSSVFLLLQMAMGLFISSVTRNQFLASEVAMMVSFMPVFLLSGFLYEIPNMPEFLQYVTWLVPARYYVDFLQTSMLVGDVPSNIVKNVALMGLFTAAFLLLARLKNPKSLEG